jgi:hypothetical protein
MPNPYNLNLRIQEISNRIFAQIPKDSLKVSQGIKRPSWFQIEFSDTQKERDFLIKTAKRYNQHKDYWEKLVFCRAENNKDLIQSLIEGVTFPQDSPFLEDINLSTIDGPFYDRGWGLFITTPRKRGNSNKEAETGNVRIYPTALEAIVLPHQIVKIIQREAEFQESVKNLCRGYGEYANELQMRN